MNKLSVVGAYFSFPPSSLVNRVLPKNKIYAESRASTRLKELFVTQVEQVQWLYKLAPETIRLPARPSVPEIQVFAIELKQAELHEDVLRCIDGAVQYPLLFELRHEGRLRYTACHKRPAIGASGRWVLSEYFNSPWLREDAARQPLPVALDLTGLYEQLLQPLLPIQRRAGESLEELVARLELLRGKERELKQLELELRRERQFNRRIEVNAKLRTMKAEIEGLSEAQIADSRR